jgi:hypothetical protein
MKRLLTGLFMLAAFNVLAQKDISVEFQADIFSRHYWRGFVFGNTPAIEPQVTLSVNRFSFNLWAAQTINDSYTEIDLIPSYSFGNFTVSFLDYYNPVQDETNRFFDFSREMNRHSGELMLSYNGEGKLPLRLMAATFLYADRHIETERHMYSTYLEAALPFAMAGTEAEFSVGVSPWESFYSERFAMVHAGFTISDHIEAGAGVTLPYRLSLFANPSTSEAWVIFSFGFNRIRNRH